MFFKKKIFFLNKISIKKISFFRKIIKIESFNNSYCDSLGNFIRRNLFLTNFSFYISYIKIFNINSEYSNLKGIKEDLNEIINNISKILIRIENDLIAYLIIKKIGPCIIKAKDIFSDKKIFILNPNIIIANITKKVLFFIIMKCNYKNLENDNFYFNKKFFKSKVIKLNNNKTPIKNINYFIHKKYFNKKIKNLFIDIETDGTVTSEKCFKNCIFYIKKYFDLFYSLINIKKKINNKEKYLIINPIFIRSIDNLELSVRTSNILKKNNIYLIGDLIQKSEQYLINISNMNEKIFFEILNSLKNKKLKLNTKIEYEIQF